MKLIFNNDDFGLCPSVNNAVEQAYKNGVVKSTTILANSDYFDEAVEIAKRNEGLGVGVHLCLSMLKPLTKNVTLTDENGNFHKQLYYLDRNNHVDEKEIEAEFEAQIKKVIDAGIKIDHLDGHHHLYAVLPEAYEASKKLSKKYNVPLRNYHQEEVDGVMFKGNFTEEFYGSKDVNELIKIIEKNNQYDVVEFMSHISTEEGMDVLKSYTSYNQNRSNELNILCSQELKDYLESHNIEVVNYQI